MNIFQQLIHNPVLISGLVAMWFAQLIKPPISYLRYRRWNWWLLYSSGGMPSSHSALIFGAATSIGLFIGFDTPLFALAIITSMIVLYDAAGVRREAGVHAQRINAIFKELLSGHPISEKQLNELIGHTRRQVLAGSLMGMLVALLIWLNW